MFHYAKRAHFVELAGPLTAYEVLKALGEAQLFECIRNQVLTLWLARHLPGRQGEQEDEDQDEGRPVDSLPLMPEWAKLYEGREFTMNGRTFKVQPEVFRPLEPPAEFDPITNKSLDEVADLMGGKERAIDYITGGGATFFVGLKPGPPKGHAARGATTAGGSSINEWTMKWSQPFG
jgi:hypothetical protein